MQNRRNVRWGLLSSALALVGTFIYIGTHADHTPAAGSPILDAPRATPEDRLTAVERVVSERNRAASEETARFTADGWQLVATPPPDRRVLDLDPSLLADHREAELRTQLASTVPQLHHARNLALIARAAETPATREVAVLALGKIDSELAREELIRLLTEDLLPEDDLARRQVPALLRPADLDDPAAARFATLLDHPRLTRAEKRQLAFNLALVGLRDGMTLDAATLAGLSPGARALLDEMTALGSKSFLAHSHQHHD